MSEHAYRLLQELPFPSGRTLAKSVMNILAWRYDDLEGQAWPSVGRLAREAASTERHVRKQLAWLRAAGWVAVEHRRRWNGTMSSNAYTFPWLTDASDEAEATDAPPVSQDRGQDTPPVAADRRVGGRAGLANALANAPHPLSGTGSPPVQNGATSCPPGQDLKTTLENNLRKQPTSSGDDFASLKDDGADVELAAVSADVLVGWRPASAPRALSEADFEALKRERQAQAAAHKAAHPELYEEGA